MRPPRPDRSGHSLIEFAVAILVILAVAVPIFGLYSQGLRSLREAEARSRAALLARELLEEIAAQSFEEPGTAGSFGRDSGEPAGSRIEYDDADDYADYGPHDPPLDLSGQPIAGFEGFSRSVQVENVAGGDFGRLEAQGSTAWKRVVVRVTSSFPGECDVRLETVVGRD